MVTSTGTTKVNEVDLPRIDGLAETCQGPIECLVGDALGWTVALFFTGVAGAVLLLALVHLRDAASVLAEERERTVAERESFAAFGRRVAALDPEGSGPVARRDGGRPRENAQPPPTLHGRANTGAGSGSGLSAVRDAYRSTVMDVPHYEEEYDEPFRTHLSAEFGTDLAQAVGTETTLSPQLQSVLVSKARASRDLRSEMVRALDDESEDLSAATEELEAVERRLVAMADRPISDRSYDDLRAVRERLGDMESRVSDHLAERQRSIHAQQFNRGRVRTDGPETLQSYLYGPLEVTYPVLADGTRILGRVRTARRRVESAIAAGPWALGQ